MFKKLFFLVALSTVISGCGNPLNGNGVSNEPVHTGDKEYEGVRGTWPDEEPEESATSTAETDENTVAEAEVAPEEPAAPSPVTKVYVAPQRLNLRTSPEVRPGNIVAVLDFNDTLEIVDPTIIGPYKFVAVRVVQSRALVNSSVTYYTSSQHLNTNRVNTKGAPTAVAANKYFIVTNIATEKVRVYKTCEAGEGCVNKMIFEQDVVNGEDKDGTHTNVGHYRLMSWEKFYETPGKYPAWYKAGYPAVPSSGASMSSWFSDEYMPGGRGEMRGAFGWYTMKVGPNPAGQWMHGTAGWGRDKKDFILFKESFMGMLTSLFASIRSHGCTRIDNESIAYLRSLLPLGTTYVKIYAKEAYRDKARATYSQETLTWPYIMTKNGGGVTNNHQLADRETVLAQGTSQSQWLEQGKFSVDQYPDAVVGDLYRLGSGAFHGVFLVDEGTTVGYQHPRGTSLGGYPDGGLPNVMYSADTNYSLAEDERWSRNNSGGNDSSFPSSGD